MNSIVYIDNYDKYALVLKLDLTSGQCEMISREAAKELGLKDGFGAAVEEGGATFGVYASSEGPVLFNNQNRMLAKFGITSASVERDVSSGINRFSVHNDGKYIFGTHYKERIGLGTNPYDREHEDIDLFQMIASGLKREQFFKNYART